MIDASLSLVGRSCPLKVRELTTFKKNAKHRKEKIYLHYCKKVSYVLTRGVQLVKPPTPASFSPQIDRRL